MATFTILSPEIYLPLLNKWYPKLGDFVELTEICGGLANSNYCLRSAENVRYLLKVCDEKSLAELVVQVRVLEALRLIGFKCPYVYPHGDRVRDDITASQPEDCVLQAEHLRIILYDFLPGSPGEVSQVTPKMMHDLGFNLAKLHSISICPTSLGLPSYPLGVSVIRGFCEAQAGHSQYSPEFEAYLLSQADFFEPWMNDNTLPQGLIHGDLFPDNAMFASDGALVSILDFEEISHGPLILDVGMTIVGCAYPTKESIDLGLARSFIQGYEEIRPLLSNEHQSLSHFTSFAALTIAFWRYRQFNVRHPEAGLQDHFKAMWDRARQVPVDLYRQLKNE